MNDLSITINQSMDVILVGSDVENDNLTFSIVDNPNKGTVSISGNVAHFLQLISEQIPLLIRQTMVWLIAIKLQFLSK